MWRGSIENVGRTMLAGEKNGDNSSPRFYIEWEHTIDLMKI